MHSLEVRRSAGAEVQRRLLRTTRVRAMPGLEDGVQPVPHDLLMGSILVGQHEAGHLDGTARRVDHIVMNRVAGV